MGIECLKYLLAAAGLQIDRSAAENLRPNKSFHLLLEGKKRPARSSVAAFSLDPLPLPGKRKYRQI